MRIIFILLSVSSLAHAEITEVHLYNYCNMEHSAVLKLAAQSSVYGATIISYDNEYQTNKYVDIAQEFLDQDELRVRSVMRTKRDNTAGAGVICNGEPLKKAENSEELKIILQECVYILKNATYIGAEKLKDISVDW